MMCQRQENDALADFRILEADPAGKAGLCIDDQTLSTFLLEIVPSQ
jgi:hypothetical protein